MLTTVRRACSNSIGPKKKQKQQASENWSAQASEALRTPSFVGLRGRTQGDPGELKRQRPSKVRARSQRAAFGCRALTGRRAMGRFRRSGCRLPGAEVWRGPNAVLSGSSWTRAGDARVASGMTSSQARACVVRRIEINVPYVPCVPHQTSSSSSGAVEGCSSVRRRKPRNPRSRLPPGERQFSNPWSVSQLL